jgi:hypothetical protein
MPLVEPLLLVRVGVVTAVKARAELRIGKDFVSFVDAGHLLLSLLLGETLLGGLIGVVLLGKLAVRRLDLAVVGVVGNSEDLVIVLCFAAFEGDFCIVEELVGEGALVFRGIFLGLFDGVDRGFVVLSVELSFGLVQEAEEGVLVEGDRLGAVFFRLFAVRLRVC